MSNQRLMKVKEKAGDGYAKTNAIAPPPLDTSASRVRRARCYARADAATHDQKESDDERGQHLAPGTRERRGLRSER